MHTRVPHAYLDQLSVQSQRLLTPFGRVDLWLLRTPCTSSKQCTGTASIDTCSYFHESAAHATPLGLAASDREVQHTCCSVKE
mgnify:CR=1 FL=1